MFNQLSSVTVATFFGMALAQYFPPIPEGVQLLKSQFHSGVSISYKETHICETTTNVRSYAGYVNMPSTFPEDAGVSQSHSNSYFFWYFESRTNPSNAPLSIWIGGGPGANSVSSALGENGPCIVNDDSNSTTLNPWSWNNEVNVLYIDQFIAGYSYDSAVNGTIDQTMDGTPIQPANFSTKVPIANNSFSVGTFASQNPNSTTNSTSNGARALWHFTQAWFTQFPAYKPQNNKISLWTESYGGRYGPTYLAFFEEQNKKITQGSLGKSGAFYLHLDTLGIINGYVDIVTQGLSYPEMAYNNTYGLEAINQTTYEYAAESFTKPGGCRDQALTCRTLAAVGDPKDYGDNATVNDACATAFNCLVVEVQAPYAISNRSVFDIAHKNPDPFPATYSIGYLNQHWVQAALGVPVNFTANSDVVLANFEATGALTRGGSLRDIGILLDHGIKVALVYGDRDYRVPWIGGEAVSLAVESSMSARFREAGYQDIVTNQTYVGGVVRQYGKFSFSRVFEAGHEVPYYQPETAYRIFMRAVFDKDIAIGNITIHTGSTYRTLGPSSSFHIKNQLPDSPPPICYIWALLYTCTEGQIASVVDGTAIVKDFVVIGHTD